MSAPIMSAPSGRLLGQQIITATGVYTPNPLMKSFRVTCIGKGGNVLAASSGNNRASASGGDGAKAVFVLQKKDIVGKICNVTIDNSKTEFEFDGDFVSAGAGSNGQTLNSTGALVSASGGNGGTVNVTGVNNVYQENGKDGCDAVGGTVGNTYYFAENKFFVASPASGTLQSSAPSKYGKGAIGGASRAVNITARTGGAGVCIIEEFG